MSRRCRAGVAPVSLVRQRSRWSARQVNSARRRLAWRSSSGTGRSSARAAPEQRRNRTLRATGQTRFASGDDLPRLVLADHGLGRPPSGRRWWGEAVWMRPRSASSCRRAVAVSQVAARFWESACPLWRCRAYWSPLVAVGRRWSLLVAVGHRREVAHTEPASRRAGLGMEGEQVGPPATRLGTQRLALGERNRREVTQGNATHNAWRVCLFVGHAPPPLRNTGSSLEQTFVSGQGASHPSTETGGFLAVFL